MKKPVIYSVLIVLVVAAVSAQEPVESFPLSSVRLLESPFLAAQQADMEYILEMDVDRLLAPYLKEAGLEPKAEQYGNWENTGLDGHIGGHYLSALSMMYAATGNPELQARLHYMLDVLMECQQKNGNGYIGAIPGGLAMWEEIRAGKINAGSFSLNGKWVPLYNIHKIYAGLRDAYWYTGSMQAKEMLIGLTDWMMNVTADLTDAQIEEMLQSEHGGLNEVFADVAEISGNKKYLDLAERFSHRAILDPLLDQEDKLTGIHANTQIPKVVGYERVAELTGEERWSEAAEFFWETVTKNRTISIGGNSVREHFHPVDDFSSMINSNQGPETCNTYNMLRLTRLLFLRDPKPGYMEYYERALYNHILSSQHPDGGFVYFTPVRPRHYRVYSRPHEGFWCCVGSGIENHGKYGELIYAHTDQDILVNLFIPSSVVWVERGIALTQANNFPETPATEISVDPDKPTSFNLLIRKPEWVVEKGFQIRVNGKLHSFQMDQNGYAIISRKWKKGDRVTVSLPMQTKVEMLPDSSPWVSFVHGPLVLAAATDTTDLEGLFADDSRMAHVASGAFYPIDEAPMLVAEDVSDLAAQLTTAPGAGLAFSLADVTYPEKYRNLKLVPFYQIHDARYMLYWPVVDKENLERKLAELQEREARMITLENRTVDQVATGEQQPESDHNFKGEQTNAGVNEGLFWRDARGWFSYDLKNKDGEGSILRVTYFGGDRGRTFDILLNEERLTTVTLDGSHGREFYDVDYQIPDDILSRAPDGKLTLKFRAGENSLAGGVYYVRLLKP